MSDEGQNTQVASQQEPQSTPPAPKKTEVSTTKGKGRTTVLVVDAAKLADALLIDGGEHGITEVGAMRRHITGLKDPAEVGLDGRKVAFVRVVDTCSPRVQTKMVW